MGTGRQIPTMAKTEDVDPWKRVPHIKPPFTLGQLKAAIPPHCFERSVLRSFSYLLYDLSAIYALYNVATAIIPVLPSPLRYVAWPLYWAVQGSFMGGAWVVAHECAHHAFSEYRWLDDTVGFILHSTMFVPYFAFKYMHAKHHGNLGSMEQEEAIVPRIKEKQRPEVRWFFAFLRQPLIRVGFILVCFIVGWPLFVIGYITGRSYDGYRFVSLLDPWSPIFPPRRQFEIIASNLAMAAVLYALYLSAMAHGAAWVMCIYGVPLIVVDGSVVIITFLQHVHPALPHYADTEWNWLRGNLSTVDRDFGVLNHILHHITDTHMLHHLFPMIPHYHAKEATIAIRPLLGEYYCFDDTPLIKAVYRETQCMCYVEKDRTESGTGIFWYAYGS